MDDKTMAFILRRALSRNWHEEALENWEAYLKQRRLVKNLRKQNRHLRQCLNLLEVERRTV